MAIATERRADVSVTIGGREITFETGKLAKQADGSVIVRSGDTMVLATAQGRMEPREGADFFPLTVDVEERMYAAGKIPGGFFKRERGMNEKEVLTSRFIDRALRPLFPDGYRDETQVTAQVISADPEYETDVLAFVGASAAVMLSDVPFPAPIAAVRVSRVDGKLIANPTHAEIEAADLSIIVAGSANALVMVEGGAKQVSEAAVLEALRFGHKEILKLIDAQTQLVAKAGKQKRVVAPPAKDAELLRKIEGMALDRIRAASRTREKKLRHKAFDEIDAEVIKAIVTPFRDAPRELGSLAQVEAAQSAGRKLSADVKEILHDLRGKVMRDDILDGKPRIDGRSTTDIRQITASVGELGSPHGSALFTRGETQAMVTVTLGGSRDEQMIEGLKDTFYRDFFMHYNFLPFSTGEVRPLRAPNRREQGHGALAEHETVDRAHVEIGEDHVEVARREERQCVTRGGLPLGGESSTIQVECERLGHVWIVIDDQYLAGHWLGIHGVGVRLGAGLGIVT
jgi:polyribonucleotide nucleotidyltransferase